MPTNQNNTIKKKN